MSVLAFQITGVTIVYSTVCSGADQRKHQSSSSLAFVRGIHRWPVNSPHKGPKMRKLFPLDDVIMAALSLKCFNSLLAPGRPRWHFKTAIFNLVLLIVIFTSSKDNALRWMPWDLTDNKSTLVQVMAWCCQATSHYLSQCWPSSMSPYGVTRPQLVKSYARILCVFVLFIIWIL